MNRIFFAILFTIVIVQSGCISSRSQGKEYYIQNKKRIDSIYRNYLSLCSVQEFSIQVHGKKAEIIGLEINADSNIWNYSFKGSAESLTDTLVKFKLNKTEISNFLEQLQDMHASWIYRQPYYDKMEKKLQVLVSFRLGKKRLFGRISYVNLVYFDERVNENKSSECVVNCKKFYQLERRVYFNVAASFR